MSPSPGEKYIGSNKFNTTYWSITLLIAFFVSIGIGRLYALISLVNPIIYLNFLALAGAVILLAIVTVGIRSLGKSRNRTLNITSSVFIGTIAWLAHWAHIDNMDTHKGFWKSMANFPHVLGFMVDFAGNRNIGVGRLGSNPVGIDPAILFICYLIETAAFFAPVYFTVKAKEYYCEDCDQGYTSVTAYIESNDKLYQYPTEMSRGDLTFLKDLVFHRSLSTLDLDPREKPGIGAIELHYCDKCNLNAIVNVKAGVLKQDEKERRTMGSEDILLEDTYITNDSKLRLQVSFLLEKQATGLVRIG